MRKFLKVVVVLLILGAGTAIFMYMLSTQPPPQRQPEAEKPVLVEVVTAQPSQEQISVSAMGTVMPAKQVTVVPEVTGRIVYQSRKLLPGGRFHKGEVLLKIEATDYDLATKQAQANVVQAKMNLARERGLKSVAEREWKMIQNDVQPTDEGKKLALHEIQLENAQAALAAAQSTYEQAKLRLSRTTITAPFNCLVQEEFVDVGQVVSPASRVAILVATDQVWVQVSVPVDRLKWIHIPRLGEKGGSTAIVRQQLGSGAPIERQGRVIRLLGDLDPRGKMARLLVEVDDPFGDRQSNGHLPLLLGAYVSVSIQGSEVQDVYELPSYALRENNLVWVKNQENKLEFHPVEVIWTKKDHVFVHATFEPQDQIIVSRLVTPVEGLQLRTKDEAENGENQAESLDAQTKKPEARL